MAQLFDMILSVYDPRVLWATLILLLLIGLRKVLTHLLINFMNQLFSKGKYLPKLFESYRKPVQYLFIVIGVYLFVYIFPYLNVENPLFIKVVQSIIIILISWGFYHFIPDFFGMFQQKDDEDPKIKDAFTPFVTRIARLVLTLITLTVILEVFRYSISGLITGLGLGGLAVALAAQDILANLFAGFVILTEKPFVMGDWIESSSGEGVVEDINFRSTKVRTFSQGLITIPNSTLVNEPITNLTKRGKRRVLTNIKLPYETPVEKVKEVVGAIHDLLIHHEGVHQETIYVAFDEYKEDGMELLIYYFTKTTAYDEYLQIKEDINYQVMNILVAKNLSVQIPSRKIYQS